MKANEIQIGDLVFVNGTPRKVCAITKKKIGYHRYESLDCTRMHYAVLQEVTPIHIYPEILEKNGLDKVPELSMVLNRDTMPLYHSPMLHYVHELQHALRLCGLVDLADSLEL